MALFRTTAFNGSCPACEVVSRADRGRTAYPIDVIWGILRRMDLPYSLPAWVPWWVNIAVLVPAILFLLAFVLMPFSVFGVKGRLEGIEARLDEIQGEIRSLSLRLPEPSGNRVTDYDALPLAMPDAYHTPETYQPPEEPVRSRPPIPPAPRYPMGDRATAPSAPPRWADPRSRAEPRLDRPR